MLDQGIFAASTFTIQIVLARGLSPDVYGTFTVGFTALLLSTIVHSALLVEPMIVLAPGLRQREPRSYLMFLIVSHAGITFGLALLQAIVGLILLQAWAPAKGIVWASVILPVFLLPTLLRRMAFIIGRPLTAVIGSSAYGGATLIALAAISRASSLSLVSALASLAIGALLASLIVLWLTRAHLARVSAERARNYLESHLKFGSWAVATAIAYWIPGNVYYFLLPALHGPEAAAELRAVMNPLLPALHAFAALGFILVPALVRRRGSLRFTNLSRVALGGLGLLGGAYAALLVLFAPLLEEVMYAGQYNVGPRMWLGGLIVILAGLGAVVSASARALERPDLAFRAHAIGGVVGLAIGGAMSPTAGVVAALIGIAISMATSAIVLAFIIWRGAAAKSSSEWAGEEVGH